MLRFLRGSLVSMLALVFEWAFGQMAAAFCQFPQPLNACAPLPTILTAAPLIVAAGGVLYSIYAFYRDFHCGDYWRDLADAGVPLTRTAARPY